eukprot:1552272-Pyramimonas_sp.AAC.1
MCIRDRSLGAAARLRAGPRGGGGAAACLGRPERIAICVRSTSEILSPARSGRRCSEWRPSPAGAAARP